MDKRKQYKIRLKIDTAIEVHVPGLADNLAIMSNPDAQKVIAEGEKDFKKGDVILLEDA
jgi:hypothetical protein